MSTLLAKPARSVGAHVRDWRQRRRLSQLALALDAEISQKHLSFIESGRATPSRAMVLHLAERLDVPLRERNAMVLAAGYAPIYPERSLDDAALAPARQAIEAILRGHDPYPALTVDRYWNLVSANAAVHRLLRLVADATLLHAPVNVLRLALAPGGLARHIVNLGEWRAHLMGRLHRQIELTGDAALATLRDDLLAWSPSEERTPTEPDRYGGIAVSLLLNTPGGQLSLLSTTTVFGTPVDVTLSELALESFFPADATTAEVLRMMALHGA